jgi:hypothetical protein
MIESREYLAAVARLKKWRKAELNRALAEVPKPAPKTPVKPHPLNEPTPRRYSTYTESPMGRGLA